jgi:Flp pilus assembly protein TadD
VDREEQGDLLAEAVTGLFSQERETDSPDGDEERASGEVVQPRKTGPGPAADPIRETVSGPGATPIPDTPWERTMAWAKQRTQEGRLEEAEELYRELVDEDPANVRALNNLGILLDEKGDHEGAVTYLRAARQLDPHNQEVLGNLGAALAALGRYAEAEGEFRAAFRLDPGNLQIRANLGILLFRRGLYEQAIAELEVVCKAKPEDGFPLFYQGEALNRLGRVDEAIRALQRVTELVPNYQKAYYTLGVLFDKKNLPERAAAMYRKSRELSDS